MVTVYEREIEIDGLPVFGRYTLYRDGDMLILHLLGMVPIQRRHCAVVEEPVELRNIKIKLPNLSARSVTSKPDGENIEFTLKGGCTEFTVESFKGHKLIVIEQ